MNLEKIIAELRNEVNSINEAIAALQRLLPNHSEENGESGGRGARAAAKIQKPEN